MPQAEIAGSGQRPLDLRKDALRFAGLPRRHCLTKDLIVTRTRSAKADVPSERAEIHAFAVDEALSRFES